MIGMQELMVNTTSVKIKLQITVEMSGLNDNSYVNNITISLSPYVQILSMVSILSK